MWNMWEPIAKKKKSEKTMKWLEAIYVSHSFGLWIPSHFVCRWKPTTESFYYPSSWWDQNEIPFKFRYVPIYNIAKCNSEMWCPHCFLLRTLMTCLIGKYTMNKETDETEIDEHQQPKYKQHPHPIYGIRVIMVQSKFSQVVRTFVDWYPYYP